jgi:hypothetical protein
MFSLRGYSSSVTLLLVLAAAGAHAERGAVSLDVGGGFVATRQRAPYDTSGSVVGTEGSVWLGGRVAITNSIELTASLFFDLPATFDVASVGVPTGADTARGTLESKVNRKGMLLGARFVDGLRWRLIAGGELGLSQTTFSSQQLYDVTDPSGPRNYGLALQDSSRMSLLLAPSAGIQWTGDRLSVSFVPRFQWAVGGGRPSWTVAFPLTVGWDWYVF